MAVTREEWIDSAVAAFRRGGVDAVSVEALARDLGVTKGSFYWHFKDRQALLDELLSLWTEETRRLIAVAVQAPRPLQRVLRFFDIVVQHRGQLPDMEFFAWARRSKAVARVATAIEGERIVFIRDQLVSAGLDKAEGMKRAESAYLATLGWIERAERTPEKATPAELRQFTRQLFGWCFQGLPMTRQGPALSLPMKAGAHAVVYVVALILGAGCAGASQPPNQKLAGETTLSAWLAAYNTGNLDSLRRFAETHFDSAALVRRSAQARAESDRWLFMNLGSMRIVQIDSASDSSISATVFQGLPDGWGRLTMRLNGAQPRRLIAREVSFFEPPPSSARISGVRTDAEIAADLSAFADRLERAGVFAGVVGVTHNGRPVVLRAYGLAHRDPDTPNTVATRFTLASVPKMFTGVAIAQLVQQGKLSYEDTVATLLPDYPNPAVARQLTVAQLLTHSSGLPEFLFNPAYRQTSTRIITPRDYWQFFASDSLRFSPGEQWEYSSSNYIVLGAIVERLTGQDFYDYVQQRVFLPARMTATSYLTSGREPRATPYTRFGPDRRPDLAAEHAVVTTLDARGSPAGGGLGTVPDLLNFANALLDHRLLGSQALASASMPRVPTNQDTMWGYGFETQVWNGVPFFGHNGFAGGTFNQVDIYPNAGYAVVVLSNTDMSGAGALAYRARLLLTAR